MGRDQSLEAQMAECRELLAEVRGATKDLRAAIKDARATFAELAEDRIDAHVKAELDKLGATTREFIDKSETAIFRRFDRLTNLLMTGSENGVPKKGGLNIEATVEDIAAALDGKPVTEMFRRE